MTYPIEKIILFEVDRPVDLTKTINAEAGIWQWTIVNETFEVDDDWNNTGYYQYINSVKFNIKSLSVDGTQYTPVTNFNDLRTVDSSFYYDTSTFKLYIHFKDFEPPLGKSIVYGAAIGYSKLPNNKVMPLYGGYFYKPLLIDVPAIKKSIDPLFFGLLKYVKSNVTLINTDGEFDNWRDLNLFGQLARVIIGDITDDYADFEKVIEGFVSNDSRTFEKFKVEIEDPRKNLTQPVATNKLNQTDWPDLADSNVNVVKPVAYGKVFNAPSICLNEDDASAADRIFLICDTEFNSVSSLDNIYVDGTLTAITGSIDLTAGTFTMTKASVFDNFDNVSIDFTATATYDGITIIKDLMLNYDGKPFIGSIWDTTEVNAASARNSSLYIDNGSFELRKAIESVCVDIDGRFFTKNNGLYTIRIYDENRIPNTREIKNYEWLNYPQIKNNGREFLSSVIVNYAKDQKEDNFLIYENTDFVDEVFARYRKKRTIEYNTLIPDVSGAEDKSDTIMNISNLVQDEVSRQCNWNLYGIEPTDFIVCSPTTRDSEPEVREVYEVLQVSNNLNDFSLNLTLRYVKDADSLPFYDTIDDNNDIPITDNNDEALIGCFTEPLAVLDTIDDNLDSPILDNNDQNLVGRV